MANPENVVRPARVGELPEADWAARLKIDDCDLHLLNDYRLEYKHGGSGYWKVLAVKRGREGRKQGYISLARLIMQPPVGLQVDHIDQDTLNNSRSNLRICTAGENQANTKRVKGISGFRGVTQSGSQWIAMFRSRHLGTFQCAEDAARAFDAAALSHFGDFASLNFPVSPRTEKAGDCPHDSTGHPLSVALTDHLPEPHRTPRISGSGFRLSPFDHVREVN